MGVASTLSVMLRCYDHAKAPLIATTMSAVINTSMNYALIFGNFGFPALGVKGAAVASLVSGWINMLMIMWFIFRLIRNRKNRFAWSIKMNVAERKQYLFMLIPVVVNEFLWGLGQNVFTSIYGHIGTKEAAAVALISPACGVVTYRGTFRIGAGSRYSDWKAPGRRAKRRSISGIKGSYVVWVYRVCSIVTTSSCVERLLCPYLSCGGLCAAYCRATADCFCCTCAV